MNSDLKVTNLSGKVVKNCVLEKNVTVLVKGTHFEIVTGFIVAIEKDRKMVVLIDVGYKVLEITLAVIVLQSLVKK